MAHEHTIAALMCEIEGLLETFQRRGIGYIDRSFIDGIDYKIDDTVYRIKIEEVANDG